MQMAKARPRAGKDAKSADKEKAPPTENTRIPEQIAEMLAVISQEELNGWKTPAAILLDPDCPLKDWLLPLYQRVIEAKLKRAKEIKDSD